MKKFILSFSLLFLTFFSSSDLQAQNVHASLNNLTISCADYADQSPLLRATTFGEVELMNWIYEGVAQQYDNLAGVQLSGVAFNGRVNPNAATSLNLKVVVYSVAQGMPGSILTSENCVLFSAPSSYQSVVIFSTPITISGSIIISVEPASLSAYDFFVETNVPPDGQNLNLIKVKQANQWFKNLAAGDPAFDYDFMIFPITNVSLTSAFSHSASGLTVTFQNQSNGAATYVWDFGDGNSSIAVSPQHTYGMSGSYQVELKAIRQGLSACVDSLEQSVNVSSVGLNEVDPAVVLAFSKGNTVKDYLYLQSRKALKLEIYSASGQLVGLFHLESGKEEKIDVSGLSPGSYIITGDFNPLRFVKL